MSSAFQFLIPEGWLRIARRFNAGIAIEEWSSPEGTAESVQLSRPFGTYASRTSNPALKRRAIVVYPSGIGRTCFASNPGGIGAEAMCEYEKQRRAELELCAPPTVTDPLHRENELRFNQLTF